MNKTAERNLAAQALCKTILSLLSILPLQARADEDTEPPRVKLEAWGEGLEVGPKMNAADRCLKGCVFIGQDLREAVFDNCDLYGSVFYQCNLSKASFKHASLTGMNITDCRTDDADFSDATINGIVGMSGGLTDPPCDVWPHGMTLSDEQFMSTRSYKNKDLRKCVIVLNRGAVSKPPRYDFRGAHLEDAYLSHGDFRQCEFTGAHIDRIELVHCEMDFKQLASTDNFNTRRSLHGSSFSMIRSIGVWDFSGMDLTGTKLFPYSPDFQVNFRDAVITDSIVHPRALSQRQLVSTRNFKEGNLCNITFCRVDFSGFDFSKANLTGSNFLGCDFAGANFADAVITNTRFVAASTSKSDVKECTGLVMRQIQTTWNYKHGRMEGVVLPRSITEKGKREASPLR
jgi:uncharacterized protein YjbI with pentapeptide repeats